MTANNHSPDDLTAFDGEVGLEVHLNAVHGFRLNGLMPMGVGEQEALHLSEHSNAKPKIDAALRVYIELHVSVGLARMTRTSAALRESIFDQAFGAAMVVGAMYDIDIEDLHGLMTIAMESAQSAGPWDLLSAAAARLKELLS